MAFRTLVLGFIALSLTACNMSGSGQKGPFKSGSNVTVVQLNNQASPISSSAESTQVNGSQGDYSAQPIQWDGWTEVSISGQYFDEFSGTDSSASLALDAITTKNKRYDTANLHVYSHLAAARIRQRVADDQTLTNAWKNTQSEMKRLFDLKKVSTDINKGVEQLSLLNGSGSYRKDNANLLLFTGSFLATGGDAATLTSLANDFADDGEINGAGAGAFNEIAIKASTDGLLNSLSQNLRNNGAGNPPNSGDMSKLPKWVVEDAGPTDETAPVISLLGENPVELDVGTAYEDASATATDDVDEVVTVTVVENSDVIDTSVAGTHTVNYSATDAAGNSSTATRTVNVNAVVDTTVPVITVTGSNPTIIVVGTSYVDEGATATDDVDENVAANAINGSDVINTSDPATFTVTYSATDIAGNTSTATRIVEVVEAPDTEAPVLTLLGDNPDSVEVSTGEVPVPYQDPSYDVSDNRDEVVNVVVDGLELIDTSNKDGSYILTYTATDVAGNTTIVERTVNIVDTTAPVITLAGNNTHEVFVDNGEVPEPYQDLGATVSDNYDNGLGYTVDLTVVDTGKVGPYTLVYNATDSSGNDAIRVERVVNVVEAPNVAPTVDAGADTSVQVNSAVTLTGIGEDTDGTITYSWTENGVEISTTASFNYTPTTEGVHTLTLTVTDNDSATASDDIVVTVTLPAPYQIVFVSDITEVPRNLDADLFAQGFTLPSPLTIVSIIDGNGNSVDEELVFDPSVVDLTTPGVYPLVFSVTDPFGRLVTKTLTVRVVNHEPIATSSSTTVDEDSSNNPITLIARDTDQGDTLTYTFTQPTNGTVTGTAPNVTYTPDADFAGTDSFTFTVSDGFAQSTGTITITVTDIPEPDTTAPVITLIGNAAINVVEGGTYTEQGATASDDRDGDISANVVIAGDTVNTNSEPGTAFIVTYNVLDATGNAATQVTRTVTITANDHTIPDLSVAEIQEYLATINNARSVARSCGVYGDFPAVEPVTWSDKLYRAAFEHSHDMSESNTFSHDGSGTIFDWTGFALNVQSSVGDRIENYEYDWLRYSENIAAGTVMDTPQEAIDGWLTSDGHCKNIMDPNVTEVGMATSANQNADFVNYWTQNFGRPRNPEPPVFDNSVSGRVTSTAGVELLGVSVKVLQNGNEIVPSSTTTIANGIFNLNLPPETEFTLTFTANGYANQVLPVKTPTIGRINLDVTMIPRGVSQAVENVPSVSLTGTDGAKVSLSPQFVDSQGNSVDASNGISLTITPVDVSTPVGIAAFPGDFAGIAQGEVTPTPIISYGTVEYQFTRDSDGAVLQLANGQIADIEIPIYTTTHQDGTAIAFDDTIQLWSLNEDTGIWTQEGTGTVVASSASPTGFALSANVSHFTWWNADVSMDQQAQVIINVNAPESGSALIKTRTTANIPWGFNSSDTVVSIGGSTGALAIPSDVEVCFWAEINFTNGNSATTAESCITAVAGSSTDVTLEIQGGLLNIVASNVSVSTHILNTLYAPQIKIQPTTSESNVVYTIASGTLPVGVNLTPVNNTTAVISGVPTEAGSFSFEVKGINIDGEESIVAINYTVTDGDITTWTFGPNGNENKVLKISSANKLRVTVVGQREYGESLTILDKNGNTINVPNSSNDIGVFYNADFIILGDLISISYLGNSPSDITVAISIPQKPIITLLGDSTVIVANGENYIDAGATASDDQDGDITANIVVTDLPVNTSVGGSYTITFNVIDSDGNSADEVTRTVDVGFDRLELLGAYTTTGDSSQVVLSPDENTAYVYQGSITEILNVSNPELPVLLGSFAGGQHAVLSPDGTKLYHGTGGLKVVDVTDPTNPVNKGSWSTFYSKDIAISPDGTKVYMVRHTFLHVIDVTDDDNPTVVGQFSPASYYYVDKLALSPDGTKAYLSFNNASNQKDYLYAVDVSDPTSPLFLDWKQESYIGNVYVSADGLKIHLVRRGGTFGDGEIETFDVSDPSNLSYQTSIGDLPTDNLVLSSDNIRSYSSNGTNGGNGHVFISSDIKSNATAYSGLSAEELGRIDVGASIQDIALSEDSSIAYLATGQNGLQIINLRGAPLFIKASNVNVVAYINGEVEDVNIQSVSAQSTVSYTIISGILPAGLTLTSTGDTTAVISGTPVETGAFDVTVQGINADGEIASIQLQFNVGETQPPVLTDQYFFEFSNDIFVNYNDYNTGGAVVSWSLLGQCGSTDWVDLDSATGEIVATQLGPDNFYCSGTIRAENAGGFSEADITIEIAFDEGGEVGIIE